MQLDYMAIPTHIKLLKRLSNILSCVLIMIQLNLMRQKVVARSSYNVSYQLQQQTAPQQKHTQISQQTMFIGMMIAFIKRYQVNVYKFLCLDFIFKLNSLLCREDFAKMYSFSLIGNRDQVIHCSIGLQLSVILIMHYLNYVNTYYVIIKLLQKLQPTFLAFPFKI